MRKSKEQGKCLKCKSLNLDYGVLELEDDQCYFPYTCGDCGHEGKEWYILKYIETTD